MSTQPGTKASVGASVSHLVLNVRDIEVSHRFYTEVLGFQQCGETRWRVGSISQVAGDEVVVRGGGPGAGDREGKTACINMHGAAPDDSAHREMNALR